MSRSEGNIDQDFFRVPASPVELTTLESFNVARPSRAERMAAGKALRQKVPRSTHAEYRPSRRRPDPVGVLEAQNATRIKALVPLRMARMLASPFAFLRGSAAIMAGDLAKIEDEPLIVRVKHLLVDTMFKALLGSVMAEVLRQAPANGNIHGGNSHGTKMTQTIRTTIEKGAPIRTKSPNV